MMRWILLLGLLAGCGDEETKKDSDRDGSPAAKDCDDDDAYRYPGAVEHCDGFDEDCDGDVDEDAEDALPWYADRDGDGYGTPDSFTLSCVEMEGASAYATDCDDGDARIHPGVRETCDDQDEDCDGEVDEGAVDAVDAYTDADGDGYGDPATVAPSCEEDALTDGTDCDDGDAAIHPGADESCDGIDTNCDGDPDLGAEDGTLAWRDADGDGYGDPADDGAVGCSLDGRATNRLDCDDSDATLSPAAGGCSPSGELETGDASFALYADDASDNAGEAMAAADLDDDGDLDLVLGVRGAGVYNQGSVYVLPGPLTGAEVLQDAEGQRTGESSSDQFGRVVVPAGDLDGDGVQDLLVSATQDGDGGVAAGAVYIYPAPMTGRNGSATTKIIGAATLNRLGSSMAAGDTNGDGQTDLVVGAYQASSEGRFYLIDPSDPTLDHAIATIEGATSSDRVGFSLATGDLDGDGLSEVVTGATGAPAVYVMGQGVTGSVTVADADATLTGPSGNYYFGYDVAIAPDADGDGYGDLFIGAPGYLAAISNQPAGVVYAASGPFSGVKSITGEAWASWTGAARDDLAGWSVAVGDVDADGRTDLAVGARGDETGSTDGGRAYLVSGVSAGAWMLANATAVVTGGTYEQYVGTSVLLADLNADGFDELLVGGPGEAYGGVDAGAVFVFAGGAP